MTTNILDRGANDNTTDEPDMLVIHCPRSVSIMPWDDISRGLVDWLATERWTIRRERDAIHAITPLHPANIN